MSRQDKTITEKHTKTLRELLKRPDNKLCADCKRNDPRWASWNIGVFLCIRCSGIHRGMGTHISKVKSVDLDVWTPEQMMSIQNWGNRRANLYWEAHLKAGHVPPDHKMESFVRSKYESRRWALEGPPPADPSVLDDSSAAATPVSDAVQQQPSAAPSSARPTHASNKSFSTRRLVSPAVQQATVTTLQPQAHQLLSAAATDKSPQPRIAPPASSAFAPQPQPQPPQNDLFTLDFHSPANDSVTVDQPKKDVKQDILSLFSAPSTSVPPASVSVGFGQFSAAPQQPSPWAADFGHNTQQRVAPVTSMVGSSGIGAWGATSGWNGEGVWGPTVTQQAVQQPQTQQHPAGFGSTNLWGSTNPVGSSDLFSSSLTSAPQKKDDVFGDLWGGFK